MDRKEFIGASEVAALLGVHPFKKPIDIYNEKLGITEETDKKSKSIALGNHLEDGLLEYFAAEYLDEALVGSFQHHLRHGVCGATLDSIVQLGSYKRRSFNEAVLEIKVIGLNGTLPYHSCYGKGGSDEVPMHVYYQLQQQMHLLKVVDGVSTQDGFIGLLGLQGQGTRLYRVPRHEHIGKMLVELCEGFWDKHIVTATPPEDNQLPSEVLF